MPKALIPANRMLSPALSFSVQREKPGQIAAV